MYYILVLISAVMFSTIICVLRREKLRNIEYVVAAIAFVSSVLMAF